MNCENTSIDFSQQPQNVTDLLKHPLQDNIDNVLHWYETGHIQIPLYALIFLLGITGNSLVILTLVQNKRMRTVTNLFLLNLAISDLLLGVLCIPFTLVGSLLRDFIFGTMVCRLLPYLQACSVSVGVWTLVAISIERYYAICHPLKSLRWRTLHHAYRIIGCIWLGSAIFMGPIAILSQLQPTKTGRHKCREKWPSVNIERSYNILLDVTLLVIPLLVQAITYSMITWTLWRGIHRQRKMNTQREQGTTRRRHNIRLRTERSPSTTTTTTISTPNQNSVYTEMTRHKKRKKSVEELRRTNAERHLVNKKRVIKMLSTVVLEFFVCWTPLYVINTVALFDPPMIYDAIGYTGISFFQLLAYSSTCCNPITYCFMNCAFRKSFLNLFGVRQRTNESDGFMLNTNEFRIDVKYNCKNNMV